MPDVDRTGDRLPLALRSRRLPTRWVMFVPSPTIEPSIDDRRACEAGAVAVLAPVGCCADPVPTPFSEGFDSLPFSPSFPSSSPPPTAFSPGTLSTFSTSPARLTHALFLVYLPRPPLGPIFSKWLSPYCQPSSSTPGQLAHVAASPKAGPPGIACPLPTGSGAGGPWAVVGEPGAAWPVAVVDVLEAAALDEDGLSELKRLLDDANDDRPATLTRLALLALGATGVPAAASATGVEFDALLAASAAPLSEASEGEVGIAAAAAINWALGVRRTAHSGSSHFHSVVRFRRELGSDLVGEGV